MWLGACAATHPREVAVSARRGEEISVGGRLFRCGTRVVLWSDPGGYDAYLQEPFFKDELAGADAIIGPRYGPRRGLAATGSLEDLQRYLDQFVIHFDVCGTSRQCFKILHDRRKLSVHFLLDADGTLYQTLDLRERAWHATKANDRSIGVEIAHIGAYSHPRHRMLVEWYRHDEAGPVLRFPAWMKQTGLPADFVGRPARPEIVRGVVQGEELWQYDFTHEQYAALARLIAALCAVLPRIRMDAPRDADGRVQSAVLDPKEFADWQGLLGHFHVQANKNDPGPAFDWERVLAAAAAAANDVEHGRPAPR